MKKLKLFVVFTNLMLCNKNMTFAQSTFAQNASTNNLSASPTTDGGYISVSSRVILKADDNGDTLWTRQFYRDSSYADWALCGQSYDGEYYAVGSIHDSLNTIGQFSLVMLKLDSFGNLTWTKGFGHNVWNNHLIQIVETKDSSYLIAGYHSFPNYNESIFLIKINNYGHLMWSKDFSNSTNLELNSVNETDDGGFIISSASGAAALLLFKTDSIGNYVWAQKFSSFLPYSASNVVQLDNGDYIVSANRSGICLFRTDGYGNLLWSKVFTHSNHEYIVSSCRTNNGGLAILGQGIAGVLLMLTDSSGNFSMAKEYGNDSATVWGSGGKGNNISQYTDGSYLVSGYYPSQLPSNTFFLLKTDSDGNNWCGATPITYTDSIINISASPTILSNSDSLIQFNTILTQGFGYSLFNTFCLSSTAIHQIENVEEEIKIYPNPASETIIISGLKQPTDFTIKNILGDVVYKISTETNIINISGLVVGFFFIESNSEKRHLVSRFIKE